MTKEKEAPGAPAPQKMGIRYDDLMARYANQVALRTTAEEVYLEFSSGVFPDPTTGQPVLPVHTRIAMTHAGARRLAEILTQSFSVPTSGGAAAQGTKGAAEASSGFPKLEK